MLQREDVTHGRDGRTVHWYKGNLAGLASILRPAVGVAPCEPGLAVGESVWRGSANGLDVVVHWEWAELQPGVMVLSDPMTIRSNVRFVVAANVAEAPEVDRLMEARLFTMLLSLLPWQEHVQRERSGASASIESSDTSALGPM